MRCGWLFYGLFFAAVRLAGAAESNLVFNGTFEADTNSDGVPDGWAAAGSSEVEQRLTAEAAPGGGRCAKLACTRFGKDSPSTHAMICEVGKVGVEKGRWYRLRLRARGVGIKNGTVEAGLSRTQPWGEAGLSESFFVGPEWENFEFLFRAGQDAPPALTRLQFWFKSTGTLWLDDVAITKSTEGQRWLPMISTESVTNFLPNSSFECGDANWGSWEPGSGGWGRNLFRLEGEVVNGEARHGGRCLKIALGPDTGPVRKFDYYDAVRQPARQVFAANHGWFRVTKGERLTLSAWLRAGEQGVVAQLAAVTPGGRTRTRQAPVGTEWVRQEFTFDAPDEYVFAAVGLDLDASKRDAAVLWLDALQLERGAHASDFAPRRALEAFAATAAAGNIFTNPAAGLAFEIRAHNDGDQPRTAAGHLLLTDFREAQVKDLPVSLAVPAKSGATKTIDGLEAGRRGFFRAVWRGDEGTNTLRCAVIAPCRAPDTPVGMNHAFPWDWMLPLAHAAGISWWRDWSVKWDTVEPQPGRFDFAATDPQIDRVVEAGGRALVLLPFPSASWSTAYRAENDKDPPNDAYKRRLATVAFAPKDYEAFGKYAAAAVARYRDRVRAFHVLNEPLYTSYALPMRHGHTMDDYLRIVEFAARAMKGVDPGITVVGGIGTGPAAPLTLEFVRCGGLNHVDVLDLHMYSPPIPADAQEADFAQLEALMREHGGPKPAWITEYGCYADDDPACVPLAVGDSAMNRSRWRSEAAAAEHLMKFTAMTFAHGIRKVFLHAGTCGPINGVDAGNVFFEYGGAPRKMYPAIAALTEFLGVPAGFAGSVDRDGLRGHVFRARAGAVGIAWSAQPKTLKLPPEIEARDVMGNPVPGPEIPLGPSPIYLVHPGGDAAAVLDVLGRR